MSRGTDSEKTDKLEILSSDASHSCHQLITQLVTSETPAIRGRETESDKTDKKLPMEVVGDLGGHLGVYEPSNAPSRLRARARGLSPACSEAEVEAALVARVRAAGGVCWKFTSPGTQGVPDRIVILPGGRVGFVELKRTGALPRPIQIRRLEQLAALDVAAFVIDHTSQIEGVLDAIRSA